MQCKCSVGCFKDSTFKLLNCEVVEKPLEGLRSKMVSPNLHFKKSHSHSYVNNRLKGREYGKSRTLLL